MRRPSREMQRPQQRQRNHRAPELPGRSRRGPATPVPASLRTQTARLTLALAVLAVVVYLPALRDGFVSWDDYKFVVGNDALTSLPGLRRIWSSIELPASFPNYPLLFTIYWLEHHLWGLNPVGYHATNIVLHAVNTVLVFVLMRALGTTAWVGGLTAALFAVHPMQVESVVWVTERKNVLSGVFYLLAFLFYVRHRRSGRWHWYGLCLAAFVMALLSKTATMVLPASLLVFELVQERRTIVAVLVRVAPMVALGGAAALVTSIVESRGATPSLSLLTRLLLAPAALWFYVGKFIVPFPLLPIYPQWQVSAAAPSWWLPLLGTVGVAVVLWRWSPPALVRWGMGHFTCTLLPVHGLVSFGYMQFSFVGDRFVYVACIGLAVGLAVGLAHARRGRAARFVTVFVGAWVLVLAGLTWRQQAYWKDSETLWTYVVRGNPGSWAAHNNLAMTLMDDDRLDAAQEHLRAALRERPDYATGQVNMAMLLYRRGDFVGSEEYSRRALALVPKLADAHSNLGLALQAQGKVEDAEVEYREALRLFPDKAELHYNLANALLGRGRVTEAVAEFERALLLKPDLAQAHTNLAGALVGLGRSDEATVHLRQVVEFKPQDADARYNLGVALLRSGRTSEAIASLQAALQLRPQFPRAREKLAEARQSAGMH